MRKKSILVMLVFTVSSSLLLSSCGISITRNYNYYYPKKTANTEKVEEQLNLDSNKKQ